MTINMNWEGGGYFSLINGDQEHLEPAEQNWMSVLLSAANGDFSHTRLLPGALPNLVPSRLAIAHSCLIGDAGSEEAFSELKGLIPQADSLLLGEIAEAISLRGRPDDVNTLLDILEQDPADENLDNVPIYISNLLESEDGMLSEMDSFSTFADYRKGVETRLAAVAALWDGDLPLHLYKGRPLNLRYVAELMLDQLHNPRFFDLRHKFEALTGTDCSTWYAGGRLNSLRCAATLEAFLDQDLESRFEEGRRYFFANVISST